MLSDACYEFHQSMLDAKGNSEAMRKAGQDLKAEISKYDREPFRYRPRDLSFLLSVIDDAIKSDHVEYWNLALDISDAMRRFHDTVPDTIEAEKARPAAGWLADCNRFEAMKLTLIGNLLTAVSAIDSAENRKEVETLIARQISGLSVRPAQTH